MKTCKVCAAALPEAVDRVQVCPACQTRYDLNARKIDNTETMVSRMDCQHRAVMFLQGSHGFGTGGSHRHDVTLCPDCGEFRVYGNVNGERFDITFALVGDDALTAAGKWLRLLRMDEESR